MEIVAFQPMEFRSLTSSSLRGVPSTRHIFPLPIDPTLSSQRMLDAMAGQRGQQKHQGQINAPVPPFRGQRQGSERHDRPMVEIKRVGMPPT